MLDKWLFFVLEATLFFAVSFTRYPLSSSRPGCSAPPRCSPTVGPQGPSFATTAQMGSIVVFATSLIGSILACALYMTVLEVMKSVDGAVASCLRVPELTVATLDNVKVVLITAIAAQVVWTPINIIS
ncbi:hypothetical protein J5N97_009169 [Dioscorea zingiberensis]|uniref:Uncharacterized protein n=1 Tax=Dioscorea zingiberensis TaxID=325984 RepID=A0A9D5HLE9_9LILI|nr:hypothetical protein J5N97_009169 [Dioscorea zingiberensis]